MAHQIFNSFAIVLQARRESPFLKRAFFTRRRRDGGSLGSGSSSTITGYFRSAASQPGRIVARCGCARARDACNHALHLRLISFSWKRARGEDRVSGERTTFAFCFRSRGIWSLHHVRRRQRQQQQQRQL